MTQLTEWRRSLASTEATLPCQGDDVPTLAARQLAEDARGRIGEIMHIAHEFGIATQVWLRPPGGGIEWIAPASEVQLVQGGSRP